MKKHLAALVGTLSLACCLGISSPASAHALSGDFSKTCTNVQIQGATLVAQCQTNAGTWIQSSLDLDNHIGNHEGHLVGNAKNFSQTCSNTTITQGRVLVTNCETTAGPILRTTYDLDSSVANIDGNLRWVW